MKRINYLLFASLLLIGFSNNVYAKASANLSGNGSVVLGNTTTIRSTISSDSAIFFIEGTLKCSGAGVDSSVSLNFDNMDNSVKSNSKSITIKPTSVGSVTCRIDAKVMDASSSSWISVSNSGTISVNKPREKTDNSYLKSLSVDGYTLEPSFNKEVFEYKVNVSADVEKIKISGRLEDNYSSVSGLGNKEVSEGDNKFDIVVVSEKGNKKTYTINVIVQDNNPITKSIDNKEYTIIKRKSILENPDKDLFIESTVKIEEIEIPAFYSEKLNLTVIGLKDDKGITYLYKVDETGNLIGRYDTITSDSITVLFEDAPKEIDGYTKTKVTINEIEYIVYQNSNKDYVLIYGTNLNNNQKDWYLYNIKEKSIQVFNMELINELNQEKAKYNDSLNQYKTVIIGLVLLSVFLLFILIIEMISKSKIKTKYKKLNKEQKNGVPVEKKNEEVKEKIVPEKKNDIAQKIETDKQNENKVEKKKDISDKIGDVEIPDIKEIEEDLGLDDELMDPDDFLDRKRWLKKRKNR